MISEDQVLQISSLFNALGNSTRLKILLIIQETNRPLHIEAVSQALKMDYAAVYRHVKILHASGLLEVYEVGRSRVLTIKNLELVKQLVHITNKIMQ